MKNFEKIMNIVFYIITSLCVIFTFQYLCDLNYNFIFKIIILLLFVLYFISYFCHKDWQETILKRYYVEREKYDILLKELLEKQKNKEAN